MQRLLFKLFIALVAVSVATISFAAMVNGNGNGHASTVDLKQNTVPLISSNIVLQNNPYVKDTLILSNNTLLSGNFLSSSTGIEPSATAYDPINGEIYVAESAIDAVSVINGSSNSIVTNITAGADPIAEAFVPSNGYLYVTDYNSGRVSIINTYSNEYIGYINVGRSPFGIAYDTTNGYLYVANYLSNSISVINPLTNTVNDTISVPSPSSIQPSPTFVTFDSKSNTVYVSDTGSGAISVIDGSDNNIVNTIDLLSTPYGMALDPLNGYLYVAQPSFNLVDVINSATNSLITEISVGKIPDQVAYDPSNGYLYVTDDDSNSISVINATSSSVLVTLSVGDSPFSAMYDPANAYVYITNYASGSLSLVAGPKFVATFTENGLPTGTAWYVNISNGLHSGPIKDSSFSFYLFNGTYSYMITTTASLYVPASSESFTVNGSSLYVPVTFSKEFRVTFTETGLPYVNGWYVVLFYANGTQIYDNQNIMNAGQNVSFRLPDGNYSYNGHISLSFYTWYYPGNFSLFSSNLTININFSKSPTGTSYYEAELVFSGLSPQNTINLSVDGLTMQISGYSGNAIFYYALDNGSYNLTITYLSDTVQGKFFIGGSNTVIFANFSVLDQKQYLVAFVESGLPSSTTWFVNTSNGQNFATSFTSMYLSEPVGLYSYSVSSSKSLYRALPSFGFFIVRGFEQFEFNNPHGNFIHIRFHKMKAFGMEFLHFFSMYFPFFLMEDSEE